jgi:hypothetical protein
MYTKDDVLYVKYPTEELAAKKNNQKRMSLSLEQLALSDYQYFRDVYTQLKDLDKKISKRCSKIVSIGSCFLPKTKCEKCGYVGMTISVAVGSETLYLEDRKNSESNNVISETYNYRDIKAHGIYCSRGCFDENNKIKLMGMSLENALYDTNDFRRIMSNAAKTNNWKVYRIVKSDTNNLIRLIAEKGMGLKLKRNIKETDPVYLFNMFEKLSYEAMIMENRYFPQFPTLENEDKKHLLVPMKVFQTY